MVAGLLAFAPAAWAASGPGLPGGYKHLVVIYEENHSFDNLYGDWGPVNGASVEGLAQAPPGRTTQVSQDGTPLGCLPQNDVNLQNAGPDATQCSATSGGKTAKGGRFPNAPFGIDQYIPATATTCPKAGAPYAPNGVVQGQGDPGGCTEDLVHRFYQEQYQLDGGKQDRYVIGSDAIGLAMGRYDTQALPIYKYLHSAGAPNYVLADRFFQAAFGGSFLNHQYLVAARAPIDTSAAPGGPNAGLHSVVDANGFPDTKYPLYTATDPAAVDKQLTQTCGPSGKGANPNVACGDFAVNTIQPSSVPFGKGAKLPLIDDVKFPNIGDRLSEANVDWNWYSGGWDDAVAGRAGGVFQYHHQPLNYFQNFAENGKYRNHLQDENKFIAAAAQGTLPSVSFVKPYGAENEHPGYASEANGSDHLVNLVKSITDGPNGKDTMIVVTYDEFGGQWDHVQPPGLGSPGVSDAFGPGTRVPALVIGARINASTVDHTVYDTTSILATIERSFGLAPLSARDAAVSDLSAAVSAGGVAAGPPGGGPGGQPTTPTVAAPSGQRPVSVNAGSGGQATTPAAPPGLWLMVGAGGTLALLVGARRLALMLRR